MRTFVISDTHFGHANIIKYCDRPFVSVEEMNASMIEKWNGTVGDDDLVIHCGDFMFYKKGDPGIFEKLKGRKILVRGNHDYGSTLALGWEAVHDVYEFKNKDAHGVERLYVASHYPHWSWNKKFHGSIHFYGHVHNIPEDQLKMPNAFNVCVEYTNYRPIPVEPIFATFDYKTGKFDYDTNMWYHDPDLIKKGEQFGLHVKD